MNKNKAHRGFNTKLKIKLVLFLFIYGIIKIQAQASFYEKVFVHVNNNVILSGGDLKYTAYLTNETDQQISSIVYFKILDCNYISVLDWKQYTSDNKVFGVKKIPENIHNGLYYLVAYTNITRSYNPGVLYTTPIFIQRIYEKPVDSICFNTTATTTDTVISVTEITSQTKLLDVGFSEDDFDLTLKPGLKLTEANLSVAISESSLIQQKNSQYLFTEYTKQTNGLLSKTYSKTKPIERGYSILSGRVINTSDSAPTVNKTVYLAYPDSTFHFKFFTTTDNGEFCFFLDSTFNNKELYLQLNDSLKVNWLIDKKDFNVKLFDEGANNQTTSSEKEKIIQLQKREIVHRVYHDDTSLINTYKTSPAQTNFFSNPVSTIKPSDYAELTNFQDICDNILPSVRCKTIGDEIQLGVVIDQQVIFKNILVSINGLPCFNMAYVKKLQAKQIKQIEVFNSVIMHGNLTFDGAISIYTNKGSIDKKALSNSFLKISHSFYPNTLQNPLKKGGEKPLVSPNIYWNGNVVLNNQEPINIKIDRPEIGLNYTITINGILNKTIPFSYFKTININK